MKERMRPPYCAINKYINNNKTRSKHKKKRNLLHFETEF